MSDWPLLSLVTFLPLVGAGFIFLFAQGGGEAADRNAKGVALMTTVLTFLISLVIWANFENGTADFQFVERHAWMGGNIDYSMGVDGISMLFVVLTAFLMPICILASWRSITMRVREYMIAFLMLECMMIGVFCALDFVLFYLFFEGGLIPMFLIIGVWGGARRVYSSFKFFLYTLLGSVLLLLALIYMYFEAGTTDIPTLMAHGFTAEAQTWLWLAFFASFAVKMPMWPVHTWLPDAHVEAPTAGSVILAGVLLKLGTYGFLRFGLYLFPEASHYFAPVFLTLGVVGIVYGAVVATMQADLKRLVAYSSVAHLGFIVLGTFALNTEGIEGGLLQMVNHGVSTGALFLLVGMIYERRHTRLIGELGGLQKSAPVMAGIFMVVMLSSIGLPGLNGFVGEFLVLLGAFNAHRWWAVVAAGGVILAALYLLWAYQRVFHGPAEGDNANMPDLTLREALVMAPLLALIVFMGVYPKPVIERMEPAVDALVEHVEMHVDGFSEPVTQMGSDIGHADDDHGEHE